MLITNEKSKLPSCWYCKSTDTGLTLNYHALAPTHYNHSVVISFIYRIYRSCTNWKIFDKCLNKAISVLENNQYPLSLIMPIINCTISKLVSGDCELTEECVDEGVLDENACLNTISDKDKFKFFVEYRGKELCPHMCIEYV